MFGQVVFYPTRCWNYNSIIFNRNSCRFREGKNSGKAIILPPPKAKGPRASRTIWDEVSSSWGCFPRNPPQKNSGHDNEWMNYRCEPCDSSRRWFSRIFPRGRMLCLCSDENIPRRICLLRGVLSRCVRTAK